MSFPENPSGEDLSKVLATRILDVPDYPQPGVVFKDITPLLGDPSAFAPVVAAMAEQVRAAGATRVAGLEARGFILAAPVALAAGVGFVPVRKAGKLPRATYREDYHLEYGTATIEVHRDAFAPGERVMIVDDILATGGTAVAAANLVRDAGAEPVGLSVLMELGFLNGRERFEQAVPEAEILTLLVV
ncbi:adenine phosphoribosyltransferase [Catenulispora sp. NF23]|uniref:Adenine phosphoribosyltransferase n=1 Tax=Catenulispora pinistramenti TaxID=2705254 RepID=A0ABS5KML7_9ACTN|nr:adenine phosphoribosyltransferase [Catenulispora pinistramenti]MBS2534546.1 adenine phosphoribosyltransferase [Catenulispora pinistramenti]MBS2547256.1 adenine phosphoribosyltransferase [Catenulispora pinistramenti]